MVHFNPDWDNCIIESGIWYGGMELYPLPVMGYLVGVNITNTGDMPNSREIDYRARFALRDTEDNTTLHEINWQYYYGQCGFLLVKPLPNMNSPHPYLLRRYAPLDKCPELRVTTVNLGPKE